MMRRPGELRISWETTFNRLCQRRGRLELSISQVIALTDLCNFNKTSCFTVTLQCSLKKWNHWPNWNIFQFGEYKYKKYTIKNPDSVKKPQLAGDLFLWKLNMASVIMLDNWSQAPLNNHFQKMAMSICIILTWKTGS